jgi:hypothetical protein
VSYDYFIWKRSDTTKTAMLEGVSDAISDALPHPAMAVVDMTAFVQEIDLHFHKPNEDPESPFLYEWNQNDELAYVVILCNYSTIKQVEPVVVDLAVKHGFLIYDPQREAVWGNKRPLHLQRKKTSRNKTLGTV